MGGDYLKQVTSERREEKEDTRGRVTSFWKPVRRDNHLRDCELMILVAAVITKIVQAGQWGCPVSVDTPPPFAWTRYTNSFTTAGPDDPRVGRNLNVVLLVSRFSNPGTTTANFTNIEFQVSTTRPTLSHHLVAPGELQLLWSTNFYWYVLEQTSNLQTDSWVETTNVPVVVGNQFQIEIDTTMGRRFFRLKQPGDSGAPRNLDHAVAALDPR